MTLQVAICDDEKTICSQLESALKKILDRQKFNIKIFHSGQELCKKLEQQAYYDLIFLDIEFAKGEINGIEVGQQIRNTFEHQATSIVYISWEKDYSIYLHEIRPLHFLVKPLEYEKIEQVVNRHLKLSGLWADDFIYKVQHDFFRVKIKNIMYLESVNRKLILHLSDGRNEVFYGTLKEVYQEQLQKFDFIHIHVSYAVNYSFVTAIKRNKVVLTTGEILPISKHKKDEVEQTFFAIVKRQGLMSRD